MGIKNKNPLKDNRKSAIIQVRLNQFLCLTKGIRKPSAIAVVGGFCFIYI